MKGRWIWLVITANLIGLIALIFFYPSAMLSPGPLVPAHAELEGRCFACHEPFAGAATDRCVACHKVADIGLRSTRGLPIERAASPTIRAAFHQELSEPTCSGCHSDHGRLVARRFSHALLRPAARDGCAACHAAPGDDLHREVGAGCKQCHSTEHWTPATFDHAQLPPATLARCESCHAKPADRFHRQLTTAACSQCHGTQRWKPSTFAHDQYFVLDRDHNATCVTCHPQNDFTRYTCFGCHEHTPANIRAEHAEEGIQDVDDCVSCHRSADEDEAGRRGGGGRGEDRGDDDD